MNQIRIYGARSAKCEYIKYELDQLIGMQKLALRSDEPIHHYLRSISHQLIKRYNYGSMKRILVPMDFSDVSINALEYAKALTQDMKAIITVAHYYHPKYSQVGVNYHEMAIHMLESITEPNYRKVSQNSMDYLTETEVKKGFPADRIIEDSAEYDLIIMGTTGTRKGMKKWIGSIAQSTIRKSKIPVLLVPNEASYNGWNHVFYPVKNRIKHLDKITWMLKSTDPFLDIMHFSSATEKDVLINDLLIIQTDELKKNKQLDLKYQSQYTPHVEQAISEYFESVNLDLLILEKGKESVGEFFFRSSVTNKLTAQLDIPILVLTDNQMCKGCDGVCCVKNDKVRTKGNLIT